MHPLRWEYRPDGLRAPALVCAFKGWNDAADAAPTALTFVAGTLEARRFATIDPEEFCDFQAQRPQVKLVDGETREIVWPAVELFEARVPRAPRDLILLVRKLEGLVGVAVDASELEEAAAEYERRVNVAVQSDPEVQAFVERLEQVTGEDGVEDTGPLPSGETIARDLQRFLRQRGGDQPS